MVAYFGIITSIFALLWTCAKYCALIIGKRALRARMWLWSRARSRVRSRALKDARELIDCAHARFAIVNVEDRMFDVTGIYNNLVDTGAMSFARMRADITEALVDEIDSGSIARGIVIAKFGSRHEGITMRMPFTDDSVVFIIDGNDS